MDFSDLDFSALAEACPCPMFIARNNGELVFFNSQLGEMVGGSPSLLKDLLAPESSAGARLAASCQPPPAKALKVSVALPDGRPAMMSMRAVADSHYIIGQIRLVEDEAVSEADKLEGVVQMARALGHELNQPLTVILGQAEILLLRFGDGGPLSERLTTIVNEVERMEELTRKLSRIVRYRTQTYADGTHYLDLEKSTD